MYLVGGLEHDFYDFPYIGNVILPFDELIFFRGVGIPPIRYMFHPIIWSYRDWQPVKCSSQQPEPRKVARQARRSRWKRLLKSLDWGLLRKVMVLTNKPYLDTIWYHDMKYIYESYLDCFHHMYRRPWYGELWSKGFLTCNYLLFLSKPCRYPSTIPTWFDMFWKVPPKPIPGCPHKLSTCLQDFPGKATSLPSTCFWMRV